MRRIFRNDYTRDWKEVARQVKAAAGWRCIRCGHEHEPATGYTLTVDHWDGDKANNHWSNLLSLCQRCHFSVQGRVIAERPWVFEHSAWFKPYVAGFYARSYLDLDLSRDEVKADLEWLLNLERRSVIDGTPKGVLRNEYQARVCHGPGGDLVAHSRGVVGHDARGVA